MNFFGSSTETADGKARAVLGDLPEDPAPFEILRTVDQKAGDAVDPDDVVATMRELDETVDATLGAVDGAGVDQKELRAAAGTIAERRDDLSQPDAMDLLSSIVDGRDVDQAAQTDDSSTDMSDAPDSDSTDSGGAPDGDVDQKQDDGDGGDDDGGGGPLAMLNDDARETVEEFADLAGKDPEECVEEVLGVDAGGGGDDTPAADGTAGDADMNAGDDYDRDREHDQMLDDAAINERVADAVTSDAVLDEMAGAVAQKLADDDQLADQLVETVDQKGDFATTDQTTATAPGGDSQTVGEAKPVSGGDE